MVEINIQSVEDLEQLHGCMIHAAKVVRSGPVAWLELEVSHIAMPKIVRVKVQPYASFTTNGGSMVVVSGLSYQTEDVEKEAVNGEGATDRHDQSTDER